MFAPEKLLYSPLWLLMNVTCFRTLPSVSPLGDPGYLQRFPHNVK